MHVSTEQQNDWGGARAFYCFLSLPSLVCWRISGQPVSSQWPRLSLCTCVSNQAEFVLCQCFPQLFCFISCLPSMHGIHYSRQIFEAFFFLTIWARAPRSNRQVTLLRLLSPYLFLFYASLFFPSNLVNSYSGLLTFASPFSASSPLFFPPRHSYFLLSSPLLSC